MVEVPERLANNLKRLREARGLTQARVAELAGMPRPTWAHLETGGGNPTLAVLLRVAAALQVSVEELIAEPPASGRHYGPDELPARKRGGVTVRKLLPDPIAGLELERMELPAGATMIGIPHTPGTREYLTCEVGSLELTTAGQRYELRPGDVVVFQGDTKHAYRNLARGTTVAYSAVVLARGG